MKYAFEMGSVAMIYIPSFITIGLDIQKLLGGGDTQTGWRSHTPTLGRWAKNEALYESKFWMFKKLVTVSMIKINEYTVLWVAYRNLE
jgi:hypothetical protein